MLTFLESCRHIMFDTEMSVDFVDVKYLRNFHYVEKKCDPLYCSHKFRLHKGTRRVTLNRKTRHKRIFSRN